MKNRILFINIFILTVILGAFLFWSGRGSVSYNLSDEGTPYLKVRVDSEERLLYPWYNEADEKYYFFLPAFVEEKDQYVKDTQGYDVVFLKSLHLPAVFIDTKSGSMDYLLEDKENEEAGSISIIEAGGNIEYSGILEKVSGRGNSTWEKYSKKPYSIKLYETEALLGMDQGKKWNLLPIWREGNKMNTKVAFDIAEAMELPYTPECEWVDLYFNGEYAGNYLLTEPITVGSGRVDIYDLEEENTAINGNMEQASAFSEGDKKGYEIANGTDLSGGYLIEKDLTDYYNQETCGFVTASGKTFTINEPAHASWEQVTYIKDYIQMIENLILDHNTEYQNYIDLDSFAGRFLVDEISMNCDANITSMYFYKNKGEDFVYAGPVWDYDGAMGEVNSGFMEGMCVDYRWSTINSFRSEEETLGWYASMYEDEIFYQKVLEKYAQALPEFEEILETRIDEYAEYIRASVEMDAIRWQNEDTRDDYPGHYRSFDNNVRYLKFYLANRLNYLNQRWGIDYKILDAPVTNETHSVIFKNGEDIIEVREVADGQVIMETPYLDEDQYWGWYYEHSVEKLRAEIPVYEDIVLFAREK